VTRQATTRVARVVCVWLLAASLGVAALARAAEPSLTDRFAAAIERGDLAAVKAIVEEGNSPDSALDYGDEPVTPLYKAAGAGRLEIAKYLIEKGADVNFRGKEWGHTPLSEAAGRGFDDVIEALLKAGADPKIKDRNGYTPFAIAALGGQVDAAEALLKYSDVNGADNYGNTLVMAATTTGQTEAIRWLVGKGADVNKVSQLEYGGRTALISAAEVGAVESARVLLELGANPHLKMKDGSTALSHALASSMKNDELIEIIKGALANPPPTKAKAVSKP
jgi:ankyrin repeat protein